MRIGTDCWLLVKRVLGVDFAAVWQPERRLTVQREPCRPPLLLRVKELGDGIPLERSHAQPLFHCPSKSRQRVFFQQPQHPDILTGSASLFVFGFQPAAQMFKTLLQRPPLQGPGMIQCPGLSFQHRQVMQWIKTDMLPLPDPPVPRHRLMDITDHHLVAVSLHHHRVVRLGYRHRVIVVIKPHQ